MTKYYYDLEEFLDALNGLQGLQSSDSLNLNLSRKRWDDDSLERLVTALKSGRCPANLKISFACSNLGLVDSEVEKIAEALTSEGCPENIKMDFRESYITAVGAKKLAEVPKFKKCSEIALANNGIGDAGAIAFADAIASGGYPQHFALNLFYNGISDVGAIEIAKAIESGQCPEYFELDIGSNSICDRGAIAFARALVSERCPQYLTLNFQNYRMISGDAGVTEIARILKSGQCPFGTHITGLGEEIETLCKENTRKKINTTPLLSTPIEQSSGLLQALLQAGMFSPMPATVGVVNPELNALIDKVATYKNDSKKSQDKHNGAIELHDKLIKFTAGAISKIELAKYLFDKLNSKEKADVEMLAGHFSHELKDYFIEARDLIAREVCRVIIESVDVAAFSPAL